MLRKVLMAGLAGSLSLLPISIRAQETVPQPVAAEAGCSGLACIFGQTLAKPQPVATQPQAEAQPAVAPSETGRSEQVKPDTLKGERPRRVRVKPKPAVRAVTIAANTVELGRLRQLAEVMPKQPVKLVSIQDGRADLSIAARLDTPAGEGRRLFVEQLHIVASDTIKSVADLEGKAVSFGPEGGTSQAAARKAFAALGVKVKETPLDVENALDGVGSGDIAAVVVLAPQPDVRLTKVSGLHLVSWPDNATLPEGAVATVINGAAYPKLVKPGDKIRAAGVDAVLVTSAKGAHEPATQTFMAALSQHAAGLARHGFDRLALDDKVARKYASRERHQ